jgi:hypothetical protein
LPAPGCPSCGTWRPLSRPSATRFLISEEAENALWRADLALAALSHALAAADSHAVEIQGEQLAALPELVRGEIAAARASARFDARAGRV